MHYWRLSTKGTTDPTERMLDVKGRFWAKVNKNTDSKCWEWTGYIEPTGYGRFRSEFGDLAHRYSYGLHNNGYKAGDKWSDGKLVMHSCDNRKCVNPEHLSIGTHKDNSMDAKNKGRTQTMSRPERSGELNVLAKIDNNTASSIYQAVGTYSSIANFYKVKESLVADIRTGRTWKSITKNLERGIYELGKL